MDALIWAMEMVIDQQVLRSYPFHEGNLVLVVVRAGLLSEPDKQNSLSKLLFCYICLKKIVPR